MEKVDQPLATAIEAITGENLPQDLREKIGTAQDWRVLDAAVLVELQDWCNLNARPDWATGESIIDAGCLIVERAIENGNIRAGRWNNLRYRSK